MAQYATTHEGVSCDGCMMPNFVGNRYKCLRCWDFDLCRTCFISERFPVESSDAQQHERDHPMQCILSHHDFELLYSDDSTRSYQTCRIAVLSCPYCGRNGFSNSDFYQHVTREHPEPPAYQVNCPLCIGLVDTEAANRVVENLKAHWVSVHYLFNPSMQSSLASSGGTEGGGSTRDPAAPAAGRGGRGARAAPLDADLMAPNGAVDLPPTGVTRNGGARRPMMARRAARQQNAAAAGGGVRTDREDRTETREQRQAAAAAAAFGMPWTEGDEVQDLFRLVQRTGAMPPRPDDARPGGIERGRLQRLRNTLGAATGNLVTNPDFITRLLGSDPSPASYASLMRDLAGEVGGSGSEYAAPRAHAASAAARSMTPPVQVIVGLGSRPVTSNQFDSIRHEDQESAHSGSTLTSGDSDEDEEEEEEEREARDADESNADAESQRSRATISSSDSSESEGEEAEAKEEESGQDIDVTSEDERIGAISRQQAIEETTLTQAEIVDMRRSEDPFAGRTVDPIKAIRANATNAEWKVIKKMLKNNDMRAKDAQLWLTTSESGGTQRADDPDSEDELWVDDLRSSRPPPPADEEDYTYNWLSVKMDTSGLAFARDSYWKDKRFIRPRKLERQESVATVDQADVARNALKSISITKAMAGGKILDDTCMLTRGEEMRKTLELWDLTQTGALDGKSEGEKQEQSLLIKTSRELDFNYDLALLTTYRMEMEEISSEMMRRMAIGSEPTERARREFEEMRKYLGRLEKAGSSVMTSTCTRLTQTSDLNDEERKKVELWKRNIFTGEGSPDSILAGAAREGEEASTGEAGVSGMQAEQEEQPGPSRST